MAYRADIEIGVKGAVYLDQLQNKLAQVSRAIDTLNAKEVVVRRTIAGAAYATPAGPGGSGVTRASAVAASAAVERQVAQTRRVEAQAELKTVKDRSIAENYISGVINRRLAAQAKELELERQKTAEVEKRAASERRKRTENVALGAGFPLLFGAGPGAVVGGALGGLIPGNPMMSVVTSAIGAQLDAAIAKISEIGIGLRQLNFDRLEQSGLRVSQVLKEQVQLLVRLGQTSQAYQVLQQEAARVTGTLPGTITDISNATGILNSAWTEFTNVASTTLGIVGAPFAAALGGLVKLVTELLKGVNGVVSLFAEGLKTVGEWSIRLVSGEEGLKRVKDLIDSINRSTGQSNAEFVQSNLIPLNEEIVLNKQILDLQKQRTAETTLSGKIQNSNITYSVQVLKNEQAYTESVVTLNEKKNSLSKEIYQQGLRQLQVIKAQSDEYAKQTRDLDIQQARRQEAERLLREQEEQRRKRQQAIEEAAREQQRYRQSILNLSKEENDNIVLGIEAYAEYLRVTKGVEASIETQLTYFDDIVQARIIALSYERTAAQEAAQTVKEEEKILKVYELKKQQLENQLATRRALLKTQEMQAIYEKAEAQGILSTQKQQRFAGVFSTTAAFDQRTSFTTDQTIVDLNEKGKKLREFITDSQTQLKNLETVASTVSQGIGDAVANSLTNGLQGLIAGTATAKEVFATFLSDVGQILAQEGAKMIATYIAIGVAKMFAGLLGGGSPTGIDGSAAGSAAFKGSFTGTGSSTFGAGGITIPGFGARAAGGPVTSSRPYIVGEKGPELFVPGTGGSVVPTGDLRAAMGSAPGMGGSPVLNMNFESTNIGGVEYVSRDQLEAAMAATRRQASRDGAKRGMSMTLDKLQQSPSTRNRVGLR